MTKIQTQDGRRRHVWISCLLFVALLAPDGVLAQSEGDKAVQGPQTTVSNRFSTAALLGQDVENRNGDLLGELSDLIVGRDGRVALAVVAVESDTLPVTVKKVAVPFDKIEVVLKWQYRTVRRQDGTEERIAWRRQNRLVFEGNRRDLLAQPEYAQIDRYPRGSASGWGVYSYPPETARE